ncbi:TlyA family RNA methyltransferase [Amycolatopsis cihanbeyliensis]|uniref:23S rRNA (Cytidine1920-2'-O)/16S rRNA (Cytidine1409-2'-O)-methyltransferase n=1 Tax=Amycolatopsis cihanbeyliensis TaxID=1128664 RepID=A0A542DEH6_AMYCI|nr:TlyA family RNA methyltransferase [Amycolatopsis cihanbeyliensis]TQJ01462.1 23S rRNA (cytidine1920-2'-O)/16S rRNA (cytidine1409-2'-O)-methyltransferase [Amycolatopsis cihanbeyliensis]
MPRRARLDAELVRRGLARSRDQAASLISEGKVTVRGLVAHKAATGVELDAPIVVRVEDDPGWASRGAHKLLGALREFLPRGLSVGGKRCLDAGASTGGFTDVLLREGAAMVVAADVGRGLLDWRLRTDERVHVLDRTNVRSLSAEQLGGEVDLVVADLSFISLRLVLPALLACTAERADLLPMVKPQFEVGRQRLGSGGVVRDPELRVEAVSTVLTEATALGLRPAGVVASPLPGPSGNVEYFAWLRRAAGGSAMDNTGEPDIARLARTAVQEGPS